MVPRRVVVTAREDPSRSWDKRKGFPDDQNPELPIARIMTRPISSRKVWYAGPSTLLVTAKSYPAACVACIIHATALTKEKPRKNRAMCEGRQ